jgi:hypothetical protein
LALRLYLKYRITTGDNFGLWPQSAVTLDALLCMQIKSCLPFSNSNPQLKPTGIIMSAIVLNRMKNWEIIADNLSKAGWSWAAFQLWIAKERSGLLMRIATTESILLCARMKS